VSDLKALHEAATPAPRVLETRAHEHVVVEGTYLRDIVYRCQAGVVKVATVTNTTDADLIVAVLNSYADGTLVERSQFDADIATEECTKERIALAVEHALLERTPVGGERMSEDVALVRRVIRDYEYDGLPVVGAAFDRILERATSLERKPLDGCDWRADLDAVVDECMRGSDEADRLAAYIEALEVAALQEGATDE
jgi:hypothetical protein